MSYGQLEQQLKELHLTAIQDQYLSMAQQARENVPGCIHIPVNF